MLDNSDRWIDIYESNWIGNETFIDFTALSFTLYLGILMLLLPRRSKLVPFIIATCYITIGQRIIIGGLDFTMLRILIIFGWFGLILQKEIHPIKLNVIDKLIICWIIVKIITHTLLWKTFGAFIYMMGQAYDTVGMYFLFRYLIKDLNDIKFLFEAIAIMIIPLALLILVEKTTGRNLFSVFGGVPEITSIRYDRLRCQGPFRHPILAGTAGAFFMPLCVALWWQRGSAWIFGRIGVIMATIIVITSASSGPVLAYLGGSVWLIMWSFRKHRQAIKLCILLAIIALDLAMKAPVWFLFARIGDIIGGTGYHRAYLIDRAIAHFKEWWLVGTQSTAHWGWGLWDVTNQYIREGVNSGMIALILFLSIIVFCFRGLNQTTLLLEKQPFSLKIFLWSLGAALFVHVLSFLSVTYFDQINVFLYLTLSSISSVYSKYTSFFDMRRTSVNMVLNPNLCKC